MEAFESERAGFSLREKSEDSNSSKRSRWAERRVLQKELIRLTRILIPNQNTNMQDKTIAQVILEKEAVKINLEKPFVFTSGMLSPIYVDNRVLISYPKERELIVKKLAVLLEQFGVDNDLVLAGTATAAIPWAAFLAQLLSLPMAYVRPKPKEHGTGKQVEGIVREGSRVVVVEDLLSTGGSSLETARALKRECQAEVLGVIAIYSHTLPEMEVNFKKENLAVDFLTDFPTVLEVATEKGLLAEEDKDDVLSWRKEGREWGKRMGFIKEV